MCERLRAPLPFPFLILPADRWTARCCAFPGGGKGVVRLRGGSRPAFRGEPGGMTAGNNPAAMGLNNSGLVTGKSCTFALIPSSVLRDRPNRPQMRRTRRFSAERGRFQWTVPRRVTALSTATVRKNRPQNPRKTTAADGSDSRKLSEGTRHVRTICRFHLLTPS